MQLSTRGRYAVMAMVDLAMQQTLGCECGPVCLAEIASRQKLSQAYLEQLFGKLRRAGLVASARGPGGGYRLAHGVRGDCHRRYHRRGRGADPRDSLRGWRRQAALTAAVEGASKCQTHDLWEELGRQIRIFLRGITLADVVAGRVIGRAMPLEDVGRLAAE